MAVQVLECSVCSLRVQEINDGDERGIEDGPDDVEFPMEGVDSYGCYLDNCVLSAAGKGGVEVLTYP